MLTSYFDYLTEFLDVDGLINLDFFPADSSSMRTLRQLSSG